jgi:hypothetical protein
VLLSSGDSFPHLIQKRRSQLGFVTYLLNCPRTMHRLVFDVRHLPVHGLCSKDVCNRDNFKCGVM